MESEPPRQRLRTPQTRSPARSHRRAAVVLLLLIWLRRAPGRRASGAQAEPSSCKAWVSTAVAYTAMRATRCSPRKLFSGVGGIWTPRAEFESRHRRCRLSSAEAAAEAAELLRQQAAERQQRLLDRQAEEARQRAERQKQRQEEILSPAAKEVFRTGSNDSNDDLPLPPWDPNAPIPQKPRRAPSLGNMFKRK